MQCRILFHDRELQRFDWCKIDPASEQDDECGTADSDQLAEICAQSAQTIVFLPQQDILLANPQLPPRASKQQLAAIAYTLEESLASDIDDCFFALLPQQADQTVPVAVIERDIMESVIALLNRQHINARLILPAACLCPWREDDELLATLCQVEGGLLLRHGVHHGLFCQPSVLAPVLQQLTKSVDASRKRVDIYGEGIVPELDDSEIFSVNRLSAIKLLAQPLDSANCINLKQKDFLSSRQWSGLIKRWRWPLTALLLLGLVSLAAVMVDSWHKQQQLDQLVQRQKTLLAQHVPGQAISDRPKDQLVKLLSQSRGGQGQAGFIDFLYEFSRLKAGFDQINIDKIVYQKDQLIVNLEAADLNSMEAFRAKLESARYPGTIDNVSINPDKTTGRLVMKEGA